MGNKQPKKEERQVINKPRSPSMDSQQKIPPKIYKNFALTSVFSTLSTSTYFISEDGMLHIHGSEKLEDLLSYDEVAFVVSGYNYLTIVKKNGDPMLLTEQEWPEYPRDFKEIRAIVKGETQGIFYVYDDEVYLNGFNLNFPLSVICLCVGETHNLFWAQGDRLFTFGKNEHGQLGAGVAKDEVFERPTEMKKFWDDDIRKIATGENHCLVLTGNNNLYAWGYNSDGRLGNPDPENGGFAPCQVTKFTDDYITSIATGYYHNLVLTDKGQAYGWGSNARKQLGNSTKEYSTVEIVEFKELSGRVTAIAGYRFHSGFLISPNNQLVLTIEETPHILQEKKFCKDGHLCYYEYYNAKFLGVSEVTWDSKRFISYPSNFKEIVFSLLCITKFNKQKLKIPKPLVHIIIEFVLKLDANI